eukprot:352281-Chlamydomonas_euryale.AAC.10
MPMLLRCQVWALLSSWPDWVAVVTALPGLYVLMSARHFPSDTHTGHVEPHHHGHACTRMLAGADVLQSSSCANLCPQALATLPAQGRVLGAYVPAHRASQASQERCHAPPLLPGLRAARE